MTSFPQRVLAVACVTGLFAFAARAAEPAIIGKARAFLGTDAALDAVKSIHFVGTMVLADSAEPTKQNRSAVEIFLQKPEQHLIKETTDKAIIVTALNGYDGWMRMQNAADATKWQLRLLGSDQIKHIRANTWENLSFYRGIEKGGGRVEDQGPATIDGIACEKIAFIHLSNIVFNRYFDVATGRLIFTETESGATMKEQGEMFANGVRFPKTLVQTSKAPGGRTQTITISFEKVTLNETFPADLFTVPTLSPK